MKTLSNKDIFPDLCQRYKSVFQKENNSEIKSLVYENGWCIINGYTKVRLSKLRTMTEELERRQSKSALREMYTLPQWLQDLWKVDSGIARQAEHDLSNYLVLNQAEQMVNLPDWLQELWTTEHKHLARKAEKFFEDRIIGHKPFRLSSNKDEKVFHDKFIEKHIDTPYITDMSLIVYPPDDCSGGTPTKYLSDEERRIVVSTIQWLGSPVGKNFLSECGFEKVKDKENG
jgi:hypothetical protein